jgi:Protein of unknown function (DUF2809)
MDTRNSARVRPRLVSSMDARVARRRRELLMLLPLVIAAGLASRRWPEALPAVVVTYAGDVLWAVMVYVLVALAWNTATSRVIAVRALAIAYTVEMSQALHLPWLDAIRQHRLGALVLGQGFLWSDLLCYFAGIAAAFLVDRAREQSRRAVLHTDGTGGETR